MKLFVLAAACGVLLSPVAAMASEGAAIGAAQPVAATPAAESAQPAEPAAPAAKAKKEKKVCHRFGASESRLGGGSICKTQAEWDAMKGSTIGSAADR